VIPNIGPLEIAIVLIIALIVFGPKRLPELGKSLGKGLSEFREGVSKIGSDDDEDDEDEDEDLETAALSPPPGDEPEVTEIINDDIREESKAEVPAEPVESEVVSERKD